jgi:hypothetical protein
VRSRPRAKPLSKREHLIAASQRRIKFVAEKGAMARLFKRRTNKALQADLLRTILPPRLAKIKNCSDYDRWLVRTIQLKCWRRYSRNGIAADRWAYFAKLINIVVYEIASNHELFRSSDWKRVRGFLHLPIDSSVLDHLHQIDRTFPKKRRLRGMTKSQYLKIQHAARTVAMKHKLPPIWFEAAWASHR